MIIHRAHPRRPFSMQGFSMLEVLIAVLVFSLGMLGLAGLLIFAISSNHVAYLRTQATFLAHNMADRMSANPVALWGNDYNDNYPVSASSSAADCSTGCTPAQLATYDKTQWSTQLRTFLPNAAGNITCGAAGIPVPPTSTQIDLRPPYGGTCTMWLSWNEARSADGKRETHYFQWVFQP